MPYEVIEDPGAPPDEPIPPEILDEIQQDAEETVTEQAKQVSKQYTRQQKKIRETIEKARRRKENRERLPDYGEVAPGEWRAVGALMYDFWEEGAVDVDPTLVTSVIQALQNEPDLISAAIGATSPEAAMGLLFAAESDELPPQVMDQLLNGATSAGGGKPFLSIMLTGHEYMRQDSGRGEVNIPWFPWTYRLSETLPSSILPWIGAVEFGWRGFVDERGDATASSEMRPKRSVFRAVQEAMGGFNLGYGLDLYLSDNSETTALRQSLTEQDVMLATMITWNETSDDDYGAAAAMMYPWVVFNLVGVGDYNHVQVLGGPGETGPYDKDAHWNWFGVVDQIISENSDFNVREWRIEDEDDLLAYAEALSNATPVAHEAMMQNSEYAALYDQTTLMSQLYGLGYPDPTNLATGIRHQPQALIAEQTDGFGANVSDLAPGFAEYQNKVQNRRVYPPTGISTKGYADPRNTIFHEPIQFIAPLPFVWAETPEGPYHLVGWEGAGNLRLVEQNMITSLCFEGNIYCPPDPPTPVDIP